MDERPPTDGIRLAFFSPCVPAEHTFLGGLLVTTPEGRPLEFQCTAPVKPNRTQVLLYGPTLKSYVLTELIGRTLVERISTRPQVVLVETAGLLAVRKQIRQAVFHVQRDERPGAVRLGQQWVSFCPGYDSDRELVAAVREQIPREADLLEPFQRIQAALNEAFGAAANSPAERGAA